MDPSHASRHFTAYPETDSPDPRGGRESNPGCDERVRTHPGCGGAVGLRGSGLDPVHCGSRVLHPDDESRGASADPCQRTRGWAESHRTAYAISALRAERPNPGATCACGASRLRRDRRPHCTSSSELDSVQFGSQVSRLGDRRPGPSAFTCRRTRVRFPGGSVGVSRGQSNCFEWRRRESNPGPQGFRSALVHVRSRIAQPAGFLDSART
jgi:hypothetical protein